MSPATLLLALGWLVCAAIAAAGWYALISGLILCRIFVGYLRREDLAPLLFFLAIALGGTWLAWWTWPFSVHVAVR